MSLLGEEMEDSTNRKINFHSALSSRLGTSGGWGKGVCVCVCALFVWTEHKENYIDNFNIDTIGSAYFFEKEKKMSTILN